MKNLLAWLDDRTGMNKVVRAALYENVPGGSRWRYVWGSTLAFVFFIQVITGLCLWLGYSPSSQTAWESVYFIQYQTTGGWLLRGIHHCAAQVMIVLLGLHVLQTMVDRAYKAPRELNFLFGLGLLMLVLGLSLTGYLLPWDQKGYWATKVATNIAGITPLIGPQLKQVIQGGNDYGHHTLTRFFALHAGVLPAAMVLLIGVHVYLFRRHGLTAKLPAKDARRNPDCAFWPDQALKDALACLAVLGVVLFLVFRWRHGDDVLGAPADPAETFHAARPEWYFLFLFQLLKYFPGRSEILGAIILPSLVLMVVMAMPWVARWKWGHRFNIAFLHALALGVLTLTWLAIAEDRGQPGYQVAVAKARVQAERAKQLAGNQGIPLAGAVTLLREDPLTQGPKLFAQYCSSCHRYGGSDGLGGLCPATQCASDLKGYGSRAWITGLINPQYVASPNYFGGNAHRDGEMAKYVRSSVAAFTPERKDQLRQIIAAVSAEARLDSQREMDQRDQALIEAGREALSDGKLRCTECHTFHKPDPNTVGPDLTGYASREWLVSFINNPAHPRFYGQKNDRMPRFGEERLLNPQAIGLIADWLRGETVSPAANPAILAQH